jgi:rhodanese-related sulfurtransferase
MKNRAILALLMALLGWSILSCSGSNQKTMTVQKLAQAAAAKNHFYLLDVRTHSEFVEGHIRFVDATIPYDSLQYHMAELSSDTTALIYCYSRSGRRSAITTDYLTSQGYTNVYNVEGGIKAWKAAGFETATGPLYVLDSLNNSETK